jgi:hypothetical protein
MCEAPWWTTLEEPRGSDSPEGTTPIDIVTADGSTATVPDELVARLVTVASRLGLRSGDLDEAVDDCCEYAAERLLAAVSPGVDACRVLDRAQSLADRVNAQGVEAQVAFLAHHHGTLRHTTGLLADVADQVRARARTAAGFEAV